MKIKNIFSVEKEMALNDFEIDRLSDKLGLLQLNSYRMVEKRIKDANGNDVSSVQCVSLRTNKQVKIDVMHDTNNKVVLEELLQKIKANPFQNQFVDFYDTIVGHYISGNGDFANVIQTYKANHIVKLEEKDVQKIYNAENNVYKTTTNL